MSSVITRRGTNLLRVKRHKDLSKKRALSNLVRTKPIDLDSSIRILIAAMNSPRRGVLLRKKKRKGIKIHRNVMEGSEATSWLRQNIGISDRMTGSVILQQILNMGYMYHIQGDIHFRDKHKEYYVLAPIFMTSGHLEKTIDEAVGLILDHVANNIPKNLPFECSSIAITKIDEKSHLSIVFGCDSTAMITLHAAIAREDAKENITHKQTIDNGESTFDSKSSSDEEHIITLEKSSEEKVKQNEESNAGNLQSKTTNNDFEAHTSIHNVIKEKEEGHIQLVEKEQEQIQKKSILNEKKESIEVEKEDIVVKEEVKLEKTEEKSVDNCVEQLLLESEKIILEETVHWPSPLKRFSFSAKVGFEEWFTEKAIALRDYIPEGPDEIPLSKGDFVDVHSKASSDWWTGCTKENFGLFPAAAVKLLTQEEAKEVDMLEGVKIQKQQEMQIQSIPGLIYSSMEFIANQWEYNEASSEKKNEFISSACGHIDNLVNALLQLEQENRQLKGLAWSAPTSATLTKARKNSTSKSSRSIMPHRLRYTPSPTTLTKKAPHTITTSIPAHLALPPRRKPPPRPPTRNKQASVTLLTSSLQTTTTEHDGNGKIVVLNYG